MQPFATVHHDFDLIVFFHRVSKPAHNSFSFSEMDLGSCLMTSVGARLGSIVPDAANDFRKLFSLAASPWAGHDSSRNQPTLLLGTLAC